MKARAPAAAAAWPCRDVVERALALTGPGLVSLYRLDLADDTVVGVAWAGRPRALVGRAVRFAEQIWPGFEPTAVRFRVDTNPLIGAVHLEGRTVLAPFAEVAAGTVDPQLVEIAGEVLGLRYTLAVPLTVGGEVVGSLAFHSRRVPTRRERCMAEALAHQAALTLENARLCAALSEQREQLELLVTDVLPQLAAVVLLGREAQGRLNLICARGDRALQTLRRAGSARATRLRQESLLPGWRLADTPASALLGHGLGDLARHPDGGARGRPGEEPAGTPRTARPPADRPADVLTARERQVAVLVARGLTNRQVAAELSITKLTADKHVANILGKLGLVSRTQVAAWAMRRGLLVAPAG